VLNNEIIYYSTLYSGNLDLLRNRGLQKHKNDKIMIHGTCTGIHVEMEMRLNVKSILIGVYFVTRVSIGSY
jgi:hypothetical protein